MRNVTCNVLSAVDTASANGIQISSSQLISASWQIVFGDATAAGTFKIQASNDICNNLYETDNFVVTNWTDIPSATTSIASGASALITLSVINYAWVRAVFVRSGGGSTTVSVNMNALSQ